VVAASGRACMGSFNTQEEAARAYNSMSLWCEQLQFSLGFE